MRTDSGHQRVRPYGLAQPCSHAAPLHPLQSSEVVARADEDDWWRLGDSFQQAVPKLQPGEQAQLNIHDETAWRALRVAEVLFGRTEGVGMNALSTEESRQRSTNRAIVVDDTDPLFTGNRPEMHRLAFSWW